jgi:cytochrome c5
MRSALVLAIVAVVSIAACDRSPAEPSASMPSDASAPGEQVAAAAPPCVSNPTTYLEIINACTDAQAIDKAVDVSPMNQPDGGLQPLP